MIVVYPKAKRISFKWEVLFLNNSLKELLKFEKTRAIIIKKAIRRFTQETSIRKIVAKTIPIAMMFM